MGGLIVGLYGEDGGLREIGHSSGFTAKEKRELVVEITVDHMSNGRIRHNAKALRWRDDMAPTACALDQLD
jgi:ATP-dependent DNA ligase